MEKPAETPSVIQVNLRLDGEMAEKVRAMAIAEDRAYNYIVKRFIKEALENIELVD